ncbi:DUF6153 family protein [Streptomyces xanthophaeus]|uniref:DUF6153 family protein n=1 Tax=Streptomyces xanthophaeus TaxID=67385 RepID=UPI003987C420
MLVLALTVGLLGMHALGPAAALQSPVTVERTSHHVATTDAGQHCPCPDDDHDTGRHISHTDMMCLRVPAQCPRHHRTGRRSRHRRRARRRRCL